MTNSPENNSQTKTLKKKKKRILYVFLGDPVVQNPPCNAGDIGSISGLGRSHTLQDNWAPASQLLNLHSSLQATTTEVHTPKTWVLQQDTVMRRQHPATSE